MFNQQFLLKHFPIFGRSLHRAQASRFLGPLGPLADTPPKVDRFGGRRHLGLMKSLVFWLDLPKRMDGFWWFLMVFAVFIGKKYISLYIGIHPPKWWFDHIWSLNMRIWHGWSMKQWGVYVNLPRPQPRYILNPENHPFLVLRAPTPGLCENCRGNSTRKPVAFTAQWIDTKQKKNRLHYFFLGDIWLHISCLCLNNRQ